MLLLLFVLPSAIYSQDFYDNTQREKWLKIAKDNTPALVETIKKPVGAVKIIADANAFQGYKAISSQSVSEVYKKSFKQQSGTVLDFGQHLTGHVTITINTLNSVQDAPLRFKLTFGEVPAEVAVPFDPYTGGLSRAWLQDEIITVMELPATITIPRRLAFRYVKIDVLGSSPYFDFTINDLTCVGTTSAVNTPDALASSTSALMAQIDAVGLTTLKECMQTVFEDGPKRDRRLWIGDLYLQAQANTYSYKQHDLTKRCLYLLAGLAQKDGFLYCNVFESPQPHAQIGSPFLFDYALLYNVLLKDYLEATGDKQTAIDLWPVAKRQMDNITTYLNSNNIFDAEKAAKNGWWLFVDWNDKLDRQAALQGIMIFSMKQTLALAKRLNKEKEVSQLPGLIDKMSSAALNTLYSKDQKLFVSGPTKQVSYASQSWLIIACVVKKKEAQTILKSLQASKNAIKPGGPYLYHYYVQALIDSGLKEDAKKIVAEYWGGMVNKGADTFWEVYDPSNEQLSPYNFYPVNSYCHAWSCTPIYFIRKYPEIFQANSK
ncbi:glycoside hydrolase [Flavobacterium rivuli WB 3.3-2 = DSM 21788]|uniref:Glycoside hydrolase n=1 Tax=Flavobacterium rivuli WB 3.3-2 = DSM 21788 TaxID=1121895 RepID=A0A0A2MAK4_9FLAO|nr:glycoside hydrolase [Flavobacterium rivuli WB 3.3-2 = DSM 21788]